MASCGIKCLKFLLFAFNLFFWAAGIAVMAVGIYARVSAKDYASLMGDSGFQTAANIMIAAGALVLLIGIIGCCGALKEHKWLLLMYAFLLLLIFILEIASGIMAYSRRDEVINKIEKTVKLAVEDDYGKKDDLTKAMDKAQKTLQCCGVDGPKDWNNSTFGHVPASCCKESGCTTSDTTKIFAKGCSVVLQDFIKSRMKSLGGIGVGIAIIQILGIIFAICLFRSIGYDKI